MNAMFKVSAMLLSSFLAQIKNEFTIKGSSQDISLTVTSLSSDGITFVSWQSYGVLSGFKVSNIGILYFGSISTVNVIIIIFHFEVFGNLPVNIGRWGHIKVFFVCYQISMF